MNQYYLIWRGLNLSMLKKFTEEVKNQLYEEVSKGFVKFMLILFFVLTFFFIFAYKFTIISYAEFSDNRSRQSFQDSLTDDIINSNPEYFKGVLQFKTSYMCREDYASNYINYFINAHIFGVICITDLGFEDPYIIKSTMYHELGHAYWYSSLNDYQRVEYKKIYLQNNATGQLTTQYSEKSVKEGFAEDFMVYNMPHLYWTNQANNTKEFFNEVLS